MKNTTKNFKKKLPSKSIKKLTNKLAYGPSKHVLAYKLTFLNGLYVTSKNVYKPIITVLDIIIFGLIV